MIWRRGASDGRDALLLARGILALRVLDWSLRRRGFAATHERARLAVQGGGTVTRNRVDIDEAQRLAALIAIAARVARVRCLPRALLLYTWLGRAGAPVRLCIGVRRQPNGLSAHAWVEWNPSCGEPQPLGEPARVRDDFAILRGGFAEEGAELETSDFAGA
jgi:hypothetical protein